MPRPRKGNAPNTNLHCSSCDAQFGICDNAWLHLTSSYIYPEYEGSLFGVAIGNETKAVPVGSSQKMAEGCDMAQVHCKSCSAMVGQCCRAAAYEHQDVLLDRQFYKLSRVYLKDAQSGQKIEPEFVDEDKQATERPGSVRLSVTPRGRLSSGSGPSASLPPPNKLLKGTSSNPSPLQLQRPSLPPQTPAKEISHKRRKLLQRPEIIDNVRSSSSEAAPETQLCLDGPVEAELATTRSLQRLTEVEARIMHEGARTTLLEYRMASCEHKSIELESSYEHLMKSRPGCDSHIADLKRDQKHYESLLAAQKQTIEQQQELLVSFQEKLESLQQSMQELQESVAKNKQSVVTAKEVQDSGAAEIEDDTMTEEEAQNLREEYEVLKAGLVQLAEDSSDAGSQASDDSGDDDDDDDDIDTTEMSVLGKRKREDGQEVKSRKIGRVSPELQLLTPTSTQMSHDQDTGHSFTPEDMDEDHIGADQGTDIEDDCARNDLNEEHTADFSKTTEDGEALMNRALGADDRGDIEVVGPQTLPATEAIGSEESTTGDSFADRVKKASVLESTQTEQANAATDTSTPVVDTSHQDNENSPVNPASTSKAKSILVPPLRKATGRFSSPAPGSFLSRAASPAVRSTFSDALAQGHRLEDTIFRHRIGRTVEGPTFEPFRRPVIAGNPYSRKSTGGGVFNVLPGFDAAITNLDKSAERHLQKATFISETVATMEDKLSTPTATTQEILQSKDQGNAPSTPATFIEASEPKSLPTKPSTPVTIKDALQPKSQPTKRRGRPSTRKGLRKSQPVIENEDECAVCRKAGKLLCCDSCPSAYHHRCVDPPLSPKDAIEGDWFCPSCSANGTGKENRIVHPSPGSTSATVTEEAAPA